MESLGDPHTSRQLDVVIRPAQVADLPYVLALATERSLDRAGADPPSTGFLVSGYTLAEYEELLDRAEYFYVATRGGGVVGFVLAYGRDRVGSGEWLNLRMAERFADFVVIKQVCVAAGCAGKGIASKLYERVIERIGERVLLAAVVAEPPNRPSKALHRK